MHLQMKNKTRERIQLSGMASAFGLFLVSGDGKRHQEYLRSIVPHFLRIANNLPCNKAFAAGFVGHSRKEILSGNKQALPL